MKHINIIIVLVVTLAAGNATKITKSRIEDTVTVEATA